MSEFVQKVVAFWLSSPDNIHGNQLDIDGTDINNGYWGDVDASVDWCEQNYRYTYFIAEFWNTLSSVPMVLYAIIGASLCYNAGVKEKRFLFSFICIANVGIGSVLYHSTLRRTAQLLDEIPMLFLSYSFLFSAINTNYLGNTNKSAIILSFLCIAHIIIYIILEWFGIFALLFLAIILIQAGCIIKTIIGDYHTYTKPMLLLLIGIGLFFASGILWNIENLYCSSVGSFQLHALWHLGGGYAMYIWNLALILIRGQYLNRRPEFKYSKKHLLHYTQWNIV